MFSGNNLVQTIIHHGFINIVSTQSIVALGQQDSVRGHKVAVTIHLIHLFRICIRIRIRIRIRIEILSTGCDRDIGGPSSHVYHHDGRASGCCGWGRVRHRRRRRRPRFASFLQRQSIGNCRRRRLQACADVASKTGLPASVFHQANVTVRKMGRHPHHHVLHQGSLVVRVVRGLSARDPEVFRTAMLVQVDLARRSNGL
mmetsp:Transcript_1054/g.2707  ORF Transcript_1054/g.2707 Transcript_1054/m.2707 type:complete len:200 (+) Transcript_1054:1757-2356(+)